MNATEILITVISVLLSLLGIGAGIIGYFLKKTMTDTENMREQTEENTLDIAVLTKDHENKHEALAKSMSELSLAIKENTLEHKEFRKFVYEKLNS